MFRDYLGPNAANCRSPWGGAGVQSMETIDGGRLAIVVKHRVRAGRRSRGDEAKQAEHYPNEG